MAEESSEISPVDARFVAAMPDDVARLLDPDLIHQLRRDFLAEYRPQGPTEHTLVRCLAQQAAVLERYTFAALAVEREGARAIPLLAGGAWDDVRHADVMLAGAVQVEGAERSERHCLALARAFQRTQRRLEELQAQRLRREEAERDAAPVPVTDETACARYLERRLRRRASCDRCHASSGNYLPSRRVWECAGCGKQFGLRYGTVMAASPLPLRTWFTAVRLLLWRPTLGITELARRLAITRLPTVRGIAKRIHEALQSENAGDLLAGLDGTVGLADFSSPSEANLP